MILYKTTTTDAKTSICGKDASGESFRFVTKPSGGEVVDLPGSYEPQLDAFVAKKDGTRTPCWATTARSDQQERLDDAAEVVGLDLARQRVRLRLSVGDSPVERRPRPADDVVDHRGQVR